MIDICFSDSVVGMLKCIKREIKSDGIFSLWMFLNLGNIDCEDLIAEQVQIEVGYYKYFSKNTTDEELEKIFSEQLKQERKKFEKFRKFINDGHKIRLWISNTANNRCGLYWLCNFLKDYTNELSMIVCPGYEYDDIAETVEEIREWSMFSNPWSMVDHIKEAHIVSEKEKLAYSNRWEELVEENAPLRILVDDMIVGVNEDFFDNAILGFVGHIPEKQVHIMGKMLRKWRGCDVAFISERIDHLIATKQIIVCKEEVDEFGCYWQRSIALT